MRYDVILYLCTLTYIASILPLHPIQEHVGKLQRAGIGLPELPHITDEQLQQLRIPLGHRARILDEARKLSSDT